VDTTYEAVVSEFVRSLENIGSLSDPGPCPRSIQLDLTDSSTASPFMPGRRTPSGAASYRPFSIIFVPSRPSAATVTRWPFSLPTFQKIRYLPVILNYQDSHDDA
jgi:hypothetical protein